MAPDLPPSLGAICVRLDTQIENEYQLHSMATLAVETFEVGSPDAVTTLSDLPLGAEGHVVAVLEPGALGERLMELGLTVGTRVQVMRRGLFGDPVQLRLRGFMLSLRKQQAQAIRVRPIARTG